MTEWPDDQSIRNCIAWNRVAMRSAEQDAARVRLVVPHGAVKRAYSNGRERTVPLTVDEYRAQREADAARFGSNIDALVGRLS